MYTYMHTYLTYVGTYIWHILYVCKHMNGRLVDRLITLSMYLRTYVYEYVSGSYNELMDQAVGWVSENHCLCFLILPKHISQYILVCVPFNRTILCIFMYFLLHVGTKEPKLLSNISAKASKNWHCCWRKLLEVRMRGIRWCTCYILIPKIYIQILDMVVL